ncbi:hypothetical protein QFC22_005948 [Naganishia vaughanmartiniae]|uniref:Uncharacterized protein n=1 Tax=Naganishia vaughanmartiniae TaxID=1424756 RepID=A0ACC2WR33_9TREE|nr:hypothetical protein QFC22_005948 [Naganishia vaughanmartiniae]
MLAQPQTNANASSSSSKSSAASVDKKLGQIWEKYKGTSPLSLREVMRCADELCGTARCVK